MSEARHPEAEKLKANQLSTLATTDFTVTRESLIADETFFASVLAKAVKDDQPLREFIKLEAAKIFNKDYDVLYELVKNKVISKNETFKDKLLKHTNDKDRLSKIEIALPLLTIFVPELPSGFSAKKWNTQTEIPVVAVQHIVNEQIDLYNGSDKPIAIPKDAIPGFPTIVIKQNERVVVKKSGKSTNKNLNSSSFTSSTVPFEFLDESFNNEVVKKGKSKSVIPDQKRLSGGGFPLNNVHLGHPDILEAWLQEQNGLEWQRDNIYYGLTPSVTTGAYRPQFSEFLYAMEFHSGTGYNKISESIAGDPTAGGVAPWTEGFFEFQLDIILNSTAGLGSVVTKYFPAYGQDLFDITYTLSGGYYYIATITPRMHVPNIELAPWNIRTNSYAWKIIISEKDPAQSLVTTYAHSSSYATNFNIGFAKIGLGFGGNATSNFNSTFQVNTTVGSDQLGDALVFFHEPIMLYYGTPNAGGTVMVKSTSVGGWLDIGLVPQATW